MPLDKQPLQATSGALGLSVWISDNLSVEHEINVILLYNGRIVCMATPSEKKGDSFIILAISALTVIGSAVLLSAKAATSMRPSSFE